MLSPQTIFIDKNKIIQIHGRTDDVINIRGHRIGSEEIESTLLKINLMKFTLKKNWLKQKKKE